MKVVVYPTNGHNHCHLSPNDQKPDEYTYERLLEKGFDVTNRYDLSNESFEELPKYGV